MNLTCRHFLSLFATSAIAAGFAASSPAQSYPPAWQPSGTYAVGDQVQKNGNVYRAIHAVSTPNLDPIRAYSYWELWQVRATTSLTIGVGQTFPSFHLAWNYIQNARIVPGASLNLNVSTAHGAFNETFSKHFSLDHPFGSSIYIKGDNTANVTFDFTGSGEGGFSVDTGHAFGGISHATLLGSTATGIFALDSSTIAGIDNVSISGFGWGLSAYRNSSINCNQNVSVSAVFNTAVESEYGSTIRLSNFTFNGTDGLTVNGADGLHAAFGGTIFGTYSNITNANHALFAEEGGIIDAAVSTVSGCQYGAYAVNRGHIVVNNSTFSANPVYDLYCSTGATIEAKTVTSSTSASNGAADGSYIFH